MIANTSITNGVLSKNPKSVIPQQDAFLEIEEPLQIKSQLFHIEGSQLRNLENVNQDITRKNHKMDFLSQVHQET